jgi:hypothetical protein
MNNLFNIKNRLFHSYLVKKIFTKVNLYKFLIIFTVGIISRAFVNYFGGVNVFIDFLHYISLLYYITFSMFIVLVHDFLNYFYMDISPSSNTISSLNSDTILNMEPAREKRPSNKSSSKNSKSSYYMPSTPEEEARYREWFNKKRSSLYSRQRPLTPEEQSEYDEMRARHKEERRVTEERRLRALRIREDRKRVQELDRTGHPIPKTDTEERAEER